MSNLYRNISGSFLLLAIAGMPWFVSAQDQQKPNDQPNIVILLADDLGYCDTSLYDCEEIPTPNIEQIANEGLLFTDGYVTAATCSPSRAALLTGRYQQRFGFEFNTGGARVTFEEKRGLPTEEVTIADILGDHGYATGLVGKWHQGMVEGFHPMDRGFDEFFGFLPGARSYFDAPADGFNAASRMFKPDDNRAGASNAGGLNSLYRGRETHTEDEYLTDALGREAEDFIERHKNEPFYLYVAFNAPHTPIEATMEYMTRFPDITDPMRRTYAAMVSALDDAVGRIIEKLDTSGLSDNTLVVFISDNGCALSTGACTNDPLRLGKLFLFEGGVRIPFAIKYPGHLPEGEIYHQSVSSLDLLPTVLSLAGVDLPTDRQYDGVDLLPYLSGEKDGAPHDALYWRNGDNKAIRMGNWKLFWNSKKDWLFDLSNDIGEVKDKSAEEPDTVNMLKQRFEEWEQDTASPSWPARPGRPRTIDGVEVEINI